MGFLGEGGVLSLSAKDCLAGLVAKGVAFCFLAADADLFLGVLLC
jgi:hypothetical protein